MLPHTLQLLLLAPRVVALGGRPSPARGRRTGQAILSSPPLPRRLRSVPRRRLAAWSTPGNVPVAGAPGAPHTRARENQVRQTERLSTPVELCLDGGKIRELSPGDLDALLLENMQHQGAVSASCQHCHALAVTVRQASHDRQASRFTLFEKQRGGAECTLASGIGGAAGIRARALEHVLARPASSRTNDRQSVTIDGLPSTKNAELRERSGVRRLGLMRRGSGFSHYRHWTA